MVLNYIRTMFASNCGHLTIMLSRERCCKENTDVLSIELYIKLLSECKYTTECCYSAEFSIFRGVQHRGG